MIPTTEELIAEARRELRKASGVPLTAKERAEEDRRLEIDEMDMFVYQKFGFKAMGPFKTMTIWTEQGAASEFRANGKRFLLHKKGPRCLLSAVEGEAEREIAVIDESDKQFVNKVFVAIGDNI